MKPRAKWQTAQLQPAGRDILSQYAGADCEPIVSKLFEKLRPHQMHLPVIGHARMPARKKTVFDEDPGMRVTLNAMAGDKRNV
jgi:hypothetical protein